MLKEEQNVVDDREFMQGFDDNQHEVDDEQENHDEQESELQDESHDEHNDQDSQDEIDYKAELEALRAKNEELEHSVKSNNGRVSALQKKIDSYEQDDNAPVDENDVDNDNNSEYSQFSEEYPDIANGTQAQIEKALEEYKAKIDADIQERFKPVQEQEEARYNEQQVSLLAESFPDWHEQEQSKEFAEWIGEQPQPIQQMLSNTDAESHAYLLSNFNNNKSQMAGQLQDRRRKKLAANKSVPNSNSNRKAIADDDFESSFNFYANKG